jgi:hypothetical protein
MLSSRTGGRPQLKSPTDGRYAAAARDASLLAEADQVLMLAAVGFSGLLGGCLAVRLKVRVANREA